MSDFYNSYGWKSKFKGKINDDHLGIELLFLTLLIEKYLVLDDEVCRGEMRNEIQRFIDQHIFSWIREWNKKVQVHSNTLCYKGIGTLIFACTEDIFSICDQNVPQIICQTVTLKIRIEKIDYCTNIILSPPFSNIIKFFIRNICMFNSYNGVFPVRGNCNSNN